MSLNLFDRVPGRFSVMDILDELEAESDGLRYYQREAVDSIMRQLETNRSTMVIMATGLGKTQVFSAVARQWQGRVLVLAHRAELVEQARSRLEQMTGEVVGTEQQAWRSGKERIVVGSTQTVFSDKRLEELARKGGFDLVIVDEAHHYAARKFRAPLDFFREAKVLGVTATPDRADEMALVGKVFDDVAYTCDIEDGIDAGYLVPVTGETITRQDIDISEVKASRSEGGLNLGQLDEAMVRAAEGIALDTLKYTTGRQGLVFCPGVKTAHYVAEAMNRERAFSCVSLDGTTDADVRKRMIKDFRAGRIQYLVNCQVLTEGFDAPAASAVIVARPTKSRALYCQMVGRGTRVLPGTVDHLEGEANAAARRAAIAASQKPECLILDFGGNAGKHTLVTPVDALAGNYNDAEVKRAKKRVKKNPGMSVLDALRQARKEIADLAANTRSKVSSEKKAFNPFQVFHINQEAEARFVQRFGYQPATPKQREFLQNKGLRPHELDGMSKFAASKMIDTMMVRRQKGLANYKQLKTLQNFGVNKVNVSFQRASEAIDYIVKRGWGRKGKIDPNELERIIGRRREAGED